MSWRGHRANRGLRGGFSGGIAQGGNGLGTEIPGDEFLVGEKKWMVRGETTLQTIEIETCSDVGFRRNGCRISREKMFEQQASK